MTLETKYVGVKFNNIITPITEVLLSAKPQPSPGGGGSGGGGSSGGAGHVSEGVIVNAETNVSSVNNIPQNNLLFSRELAYVLLVSSENINKHISKVTDQYGNEGYGVWLKYPGTASSWFFLSGDIAANDQNGTSGFLKSRAYYLEWEGQYKWYNFNENGLCIS